MISVGGIRGLFGVQSAYAAPFALELLNVALLDSDSSFSIMVQPILSLTRFSEGDEHQRVAFSVELIDNLIRDGFCKIIDHGLSDEKVAGMFGWFHKWFQMPDDIKASVAHQPGPNPQRGYSKIGSENLGTVYRHDFAPKEQNPYKDMREHWDQGSANDKRYPNKWVPEDIMPGFRSFMEEQFLTLERISDIILQAIELGLDLPKGSLTELVTHEKNASELRCNHYPPLNMEQLRDGKAGRSKAHCDLGVISMLLQDVGGLEFEDKSQADAKHFTQVEKGSRPSELVINVAETLTRWTNNRLPASLHRVTPPMTLKPAEGIVPERYSIVYFTKADRDASVAPLSFYTATGETSNYEAMSALEYQQRRLLTAYPSIPVVKTAA